jgi:hypothetical protein
MKGLLNWSTAVLGAALVTGGCSHDDQSTARNQGYDTNARTAGSAYNGAAGRDNNAGLNNPSGGYYDSSGRYVPRSDTTGTPNNANTGTSGSGSGTNTNTGTGTGTGTDTGTNGTGGTGTGAAGTGGGGGGR